MYGSVVVGEIEEDAVQAGRNCLNCFPSHLGQCQNVSHPVMQTSNVILNATSLSSVSDGCHFPPIDIVDLPSFEPLTAPSFVWGSLVGPSCNSVIKKCYSTAVHWKTNLFTVPSGKVGEAFVDELSRLFTAYATASALKSVALTAALLLRLPMLVHDGSFR